MNITLGHGTSDFGPGISIELSGNEVALAITAYLLSHNVTIVGPRTVTVNGKLCGRGSVYVDPAGVVMHDGQLFSGAAK